MEEVERMRKIELLLRRSRDFYDAALNQLGKGFYSFSVFNLEQSLQLLLKAKLMKLGMDYPKTDSLSELVEMLLRVGERPRLKELVEKFAEELKTLEEVYEIYRLSRYTPRKFERDEVVRLKEAVDKITRALEIE